MKCGKALARIVRAQRFYRSGLKMDFFAPYKHTRQEKCASFGCQNNRFLGFPQYPQRRFPLSCGWKFPCVSWLFGCCQKVFPAESTNFSTPVLWGFFPRSGMLLPIYYTMEWPFRKGLFPFFHIGGGSFLCLVYAGFCEGATPTPLAGGWSPCTPPYWS